MSMIEKTTTLHLQQSQIIQEIDKQPGLIPIDIEVGNHKLVWFDIGDHQLAESYFFISTEQLISKQEKPELFTTEIGALVADDILADYIYPSGFIFHMGRCGSIFLGQSG